GLMDSGEFQAESPVVQYEKFTREKALEAEEDKRPVGKAESIISELGDGESVKATTLAKTERRKVGKRIITMEDLDLLNQQASHIRDRAILEFLYATGAQIAETINLNLSDVDLEARQVTIHDNRSDGYRVLILPKRTVNFLKIYERWRRRQMSPSQAYFITKTTRRRMSDSSISTWLNRIQGDVATRDRWTAMDFRKRALLQHYWVTRDLTAVARFGGYKRPESALNLISDILEDQGVDSIEALASLPEFEQLKEDKRVATGGDDQLTITIQLDRDEMDIIRNSGLTPTQAVKTIISLKDLYGAFGGGGGGAPAAKAAPAGTANMKGPNMKAPAGGPNMKAPSGGPNLKAPSGGPNLKMGPGGSGPNLKAGPGGGPNLKEGPAANKLEGVQLSSAPDSEKPAMKAAPKQPPGGGGGGGPVSQLSELKDILARRRAAADADEPVGETKMPGPASLGGRIEDKDPVSSESKDKKDEDDEDEDVPDLPDFDL
ncbi:MAG: tyrosine-type recombinase/integrase, partial [Candidatus Kariarchaeaceae archaeon]